MYGGGGHISLQLRVLGKRKTRGGPVYGEPASLAAVRTNRAAGEGMAILGLVPQLPFQLDPTVASMLPSVGVDSRLVAMVSIPGSDDVREGLSLSTLVKQSDSRVVILSYGCTVASAYTATLVQILADRGIEVLDRYAQ